MKLMQLTQLGNNFEPPDEQNTTKVVGANEEHVGVLLRRYYHPRRPFILSILLTDAVNHPFCDIATVFENDYSGVFENYYSGVF